MNDEITWQASTPQDALLRAANEMEKRCERAAGEEKAHAEKREWENAAQAKTEAAAYAYACLYLRGQAKYAPNWQPTEIAAGICTCSGCGKTVLNAWNNDSGNWCLTCQAAEIKRYKVAMDAIYNHNEAARAAVIQHFGLHHSTGPAADQNAELSPAKRGDE